MLLFLENNIKQIFTEIVLWIILYYYYYLYIVLFIYNTEIVFTWTLRMDHFCQILYTALFASHDISTF